MPESDVDDRTYYVAFARAVAQGLPFESPEAMLLEAWRPGTEITRYNRTWRLSRILDEDDDIVLGRIGFVNEGDVPTLNWNSEFQDFTTGAASSGVTVPFAIRKSDLTIAYQVRPGTVRENTFIGAFSALLNAGSGDDPYWSIEAFTRDMEYPSWRKTIDHVERLDVTVDRPNPHYADDKEVENAVEGLRAERLRLVASARAGEDLNLDFPLVDQAIDHVLRGYGQAKIVAETHEGSPSTWVKLRGRVGSVLRIRSRRASGSTEAPAEVLKGMLEEEDGSQAGSATSNEDI